MRKVESHLCFKYLFQASGLRATAALVPSLCKRRWVDPGIAVQGETVRGISFEVDHCDMMLIHTSVRVPLRSQGWGA